MSHTFALPARAKAAVREPGVEKAQAAAGRSWNLTAAFSRISIVLVDLFAVLLSYWVSLKILSAYTDLWLGIAGSAIFVLLVVTTKGFALFHFGVFKGSLRYAGVRELLGLA